MSTHTPGPWSANIWLKADNINGEGKINIYGPTEGTAPVATVWGNKSLAVVNAEYIARACNAHEELLAALEDCQDYLFIDDSMAATALRRSIGATIAKATSQD